jgi:hypothetical protein
MAYSRFLTSQLVRIVKDIPKEILSTFKKIWTQQLEKLRMQAASETLHY